MAPLEMSASQAASAVSDCKAAVVLQACGQAQLVAALRALAKELWRRLGVRSPASGDEVLDVIEAQARQLCGASPSEDLTNFVPPSFSLPTASSAPAASAAPTEGSGGAPPSEPPAQRSLTEIWQSAAEKVSSFRRPGKDLEPALATICRSSKFAEVMEFTRQSQKTEELRKEVTVLQQVVQELRPEFKRVAEDATRVMKAQLECTLSVEMSRLKGECEQQLESALDLREHLQLLARDALETRLGCKLQDAAEAAAKERQQIWKHLNDEIARIDSKANSIAENMSSFDQRVCGAEKIAIERAEEARLAARDALVDFRTTDFRKQVEEQRLQRARLASTVGGLVRLSEVCGVLPDPTKLQEMHTNSLDDLLEMEAGERSSRHRISDAWATLCEGHSNFLEYLAQKTEQSMQRALAKEVGNLDARVRSECVTLVKASKAPKDENILPSLDFVRAQRERELESKALGKVEGKFDASGRFNSSAWSSMFSADLASTASTDYSPNLTERLQRPSSLLEPLASDAVSWPPHSSRELSRHYPRGASSLQRPLADARPRTSPASPGNASPSGFRSPGGLS